MAGDSSNKKRGMTLQEAQGAPMAGFAGLFVGLCFVFSFIPLSSFFPGYANSTSAALTESMRNNLNLPQSTCEAEFPLLYPQLHANEVAWAKKGGIQYSQVVNAAQNCRHGCVHVVIKHGQIFIRGQAKDWQSRVRSTMQLLSASYQGATEDEKASMESIEMVISDADFDGFTDPQRSNGAGWVLDRRVNDSEGQYLFPDFSFASWPEAGIASFPEFRRQAEKVNKETSWKSKADLAFWRGDALLGNNIKPRESLLSVATGPGTETWSDVKTTSFWEEGPHIGKIVSLPEHCRHKFLIHAEGVAYSGRSKFILSCQSAVILHQLEWEQHFHPALISKPSSPDQNHILLSGSNFENLPSTMQTLIEEERTSSKISTGERIATNAKRTLTDRYLTPAATACYLRAGLLSYRRAMDQRSWPTGQGAVVIGGGGVRPGAGTSKGTLKELGVKGDIEYGVWLNLGMPEWPPK